ncbi:Butanoate coenzyme A-transferase [bioreactor metagenome]|uniref:Butanoate coenzyme A-transferase n=1 Tax=bioreactor metagenome TaxID=1076179 RepID=A0A645BJV8_9ZZZZ
MTNWKTDYSKKMRTLDEILKLIPSDCSMITSHDAAEPRAFLAAMAAHKNAYKNVNIFMTHALEEAPYCAPGTEGHFHLSTCFAGAETRRAVNMRRADFITGFYSERPRLIGTTIPVDIAVLSLSAPDKHGYCSFGVTVDYQMKLARTARLVIGIINRYMPRTLGHEHIHISDLDYVLELDEPLTQSPSSPAGDVELAIGRHCAALINDGDTLQLGFGKIPDAVLMSLGDKHDLGIHSEMFSDGVVDMVEAGVITNRKKTLDPGLTVATFLLGTDKLYSFVDDNPRVAMRPVDYTNDPRIIAQQDNIVAINSCLQIDLYGQVCAEMVRGEQYSGVGGQLDFLRGASMARNGCAILAMPSTAQGGRLSRIVVHLDDNSVVTTTRNDVDYIITEYGVAKLRGKTLKRRAAELIAIAHPNFRDELSRQAAECF